MGGGAGAVRGVWSRRCTKEVYLGSVPSVTGEGYDTLEGISRSTDKEPAPQGGQSDHRSGSHMSRWS